MKIAFIRANLHEDEDALIVRFLNGLNHNIRDIVELHNCLDLQELVHQVIRVKQQLKRKGQFSTWKIIILLIFLLPSEKTIKKVRILGLSLKILKKIKIRVCLQFCKKKWQKSNYSTVPNFKKEKNREKKIEWCLDSFLPNFLHCIVCLTNYLVHMIFSFDWNTCVEYWTNCYSLWVLSLGALFFLLVLFGLFHLVTLISFWLSLLCSCV